MSYSIEKLPDDPIVILTTNVDNTPQPDLATVYAQLTTILDQSTEPITIIQDLRQLENADWDAIIRSASASIDFHKHPHLGMALMVTTDELYKVATAGLDSEVFGYQKVLIFDSIESAVAYARENQGGN